LITWITLLVISKIMEQLKGCDDVTKAFVLATMKDKAEGYTPRYFQHQMVGGLQTIATDAVTTCPTYTKLLEVLDSDDFDAEKKIKQILALLSTTNEESEWKSPYDSSSRTTYRGRQIPSNISSIRLSQRGSRRFARLQMRTWFTLWKQSTPSIFPTKFSSISLHPQSASSIRIHTTFLLDSIGLRWVKSILMMWFKTSISMWLWWIAHSSHHLQFNWVRALLLGSRVVQVLLPSLTYLLRQVLFAWIAQSIWYRSRRTFYTWGSVQSGRRGWESCQLVTPRQYGVNPYNPGLQEVANTSRGNLAISTPWLHVRFTNCMLLLW